MITGIWADANGQHSYIGNSEVSLSDMEWSDLALFLQSRGFEHREATGLPSPTNRPLGEDLYQHEDGRSISFTRTISPYGFEVVTSATGGSKDSQDNNFPITTIGDLTQFIELGRETSAPERGGEIVY